MSASRDDNPINATRAAHYNRSTPVTMEKLIASAEVQSIRLLNASDVFELLSIEKSIELARDAMKLVANRHTVQPLRQVTQQPTREGVLGVMPGYIADPEWLGVKVVSVFPGNSRSALGAHQGMVILFDAERGIPRAIIDARAVTALRTAAASAVATDVLARADADTLGILGYGEQAGAHLRALPHVRRFSRIMIWGRDAERAQKIARQFSAELSVRIEAVERADRAVEADVLCTTTGASEPIVHGRWLRAGQHLNVVGSSVPSTSEVDVEVLVRSRVFVDFMDSALALGGDIRNALASGDINRSHILGSIGDVLIGTVIGRTSDSDVTLFKSLGMISLDLVTCAFLFKQAEALNHGQIIAW
jgi:ornithine cyclodeaminase/alanine dehydrogenase-like protein (mu-crystallin family)